MANSSYYLNFVNDGANTFTPAARRGGTASSAGTSLTLGLAIPIPTKHLADALDAALAAVLNDFQANYASFPSYYVNIADDGAGNKTPTARRGGTASSAGTALTLGLGTPTTSKSIPIAYTALRAAILNDASDGN